MKIRVVGQIWYRNFYWRNDPRPVFELPTSEFWKQNNFITIRNSSSTDWAVPVSGEHVLKLCFDDATVNPDDSLILFDETMAQEIAAFVHKLDTERPLFINCAAGISRSGAVGEVLNDYFNRYLADREADCRYFQEHNRQVCGNPLVRRILSSTLFPSQSAFGLPEDTTP